MENVFIHIGNYCLACHRRFALLFPLSSYCISSVMSVDSNAVLYSGLACMLVETLPVSFRLFKVYHYLSEVDYNRQVGQECF